LKDKIKEKYYKEILEFLCSHADLNFFVISKDGRYLLKSSKMDDIAGKDTERADLFDKRAWNDLLQVMDSRTTKVVEEKYEGNNPAYDDHWFLSVKSPLIKNDAVEGVMGVAIDITERKKTEQKLKETKHKLEGMTLVSASIAHELRTPLQSLSLSVDSMRTFLPILLEGYKKAAEGNLLPRKLRKSTVDSLDILLEAMDKEIYSASENIDLTLNNLRSEDITEKEVLNQTFYISEIIERALERHPYKNGERKLMGSCGRTDKKWDFKSG